MSKGLKSATLSYGNLKKAIDLIGGSMNESTRGFSEFGNRLREFRYQKTIEEERISYLKEVKNYCGFRITSYYDIINIQ